MSFELKSVVPWGRTMAEYERMFLLTPADLQKKIIGFGDGPASFNAGMKQKGNPVLSLDPVYRFSKQQLQQRIAETGTEVMAQMRANRQHFIWNEIQSPEELEEIRMKAMAAFLADYENGLTEGRYHAHALPLPTNFKNGEFDLGLSSHFLLLYDGLGLDFHRAALTEMLRICKEVRVFPVLNLNLGQPLFLKELLSHFDADYQTAFIQVPYEFQKGANQMLVIRRKQ